jgi:hypothetical protein
MNHHLHHLHRRAGSYAIVYGLISSRSGRSLGQILGLITCSRSTNPRPRRLGQILFREKRTMGWLMVLVSKLANLIGWFWGPRSNKVKTTNLLEGSPTSLKYGLGILNIFLDQTNTRASQTYGLKFMVGLK